MAPLTSLILGLLLLLLPLASATNRTVPFLTLSRRLTRLRAPQICLTRKQEDIAIFSAQLELALACLPSSERAALRERCKQNDESACTRLSACPRIEPIASALRAARERECPPLNSRFERVEARWRTRLNARIRRGGLPPAMFDSIVLEPRVVDSALVLIHGVGGTAVGQLRFAEDIQKALPRTRIIIPQAHLGFVTFFNRTMPSWFDILGNTRDAPQARGQILTSAWGMNHLARVQSVVYGLARSRVGVLGVSQGGAVALTTYLRQTWGAAIGVSTYLPVAESYPDELGGGSEDVELLMVHGRIDDVVPFASGRLSRDIIRAVGRTVRWVALEGDHFLALERDIVTEEVTKQLKKAFE